jgi:hypothetical protein
MSSIPQPERPGTGQDVPDSNTPPDPRLPGPDQGVAGRPGYPDDDDDVVIDEPDSETDDPAAEPGKPI